MTCPAAQTCAYPGICRRYCGAQLAALWSDVATRDDLGWTEKNQLLEERAAQALKPIEDGAS